jgi:hypothetical protein
MNAVRKRWGLIAAVVLVVLGALFAVARFREMRLRDGPAEIRALVTIGDTGTMLVHEEVFRTNEDRNEWVRRLTLLGITDGRVRARVVIGPDWIACAPSIDNRIWCAQQRKVELRDATTLAVVADDKKIAAALGSPIADWDAWADLQSGELLVHTEDGSDVAIAPTLATRRRNRGAADEGWLVLDSRGPRSTAKRPESFGVFAAIAGKPPVVVGTDVKTMREVYRYDGTKN